MRKFFVTFAIIILLIAWTSIFLPQRPNSTKEISFLIEQGERTKNIALHLQQEGLIPSAPLFRFFALATGISGKLQAGNYIFSPALSPFEISRKLTQGDVTREYITIIEGWTIEDIAFYLAKEEFATKEDVLAYRDFEGYLFPETYHITRDMELSEIIELMLQTFQEKISSTWRNEIQEQGRTLSDIVILASILEKELQTLKDKKIAAGLLLKRLEIGMALQVDAAPITYKRRGLPEMPIANPGLSSIEAALYPTQNSYWYYLSTKEGKTIFSETLEEHNEARATHLR